MGDTWAWCGGGVVRCRGLVVVVCLFVGDALWPCLERVLPEMFNLRITSDLPSLAPTHTHPPCRYGAYCHHQGQADTAEVISCYLSLFGTATDHAAV